MYGVSTCKLEFCNLSIGAVILCVFFIFGKDLLGVEITSVHR